MAEDEMITRSVNIKVEHNEWIEQNSINFSSWIRKKIDEELMQK